MDPLQLIACCALTILGAAYAPASAAERRTADAGRPTAYGPDFSVPIPPGFMVVRDRNSLAPGPDLILRAADPEQTWIVKRGPPLGKFTAEACQGFLDRRVTEMTSEKRHAPIQTQAIVTPPQSCRYRMKFADGTEVRVFIVTAAAMSYTTACITSRGANPDESCTLLTDGFDAFIPSEVRVEGFSVPMPTGYVLGYSNVQGTIVLESDAHPQIQIQVRTASAGSCADDAATAVQESNFQLVTVSDGKPPVRCRARLRDTLDGVNALLEVRWRRFHRKDVLVICGTRNGDAEAGKTCDKVVSSIIPLSQ